MKPITTLHAELDRTRKIGVEFEMTVPLVGSGCGADVQRTLAGILTANGLRSVSRGYSHDPVPPGFDFAVEYDSSVRGETRYNGIAWFPIEIKTRILNGIDDYECLVPKMLDLVRYMGARVNASCGHHVHVSIPEAIERPKVIRSLHSLIRRIEPVIFGCLPPSRTGNNYCVPLGDEFRLLHSCKSLPCFRRVLGNWNRYHALNLSHITGSSPRVEFRHHHGTLDPVKARNWLRLVLQLVEHSVARNCQSSDQQLPNDRTGIERLLIGTGFKVNSRIYSVVSPELREAGAYLLRRWKHFNSATSTQRTDESEMRHATESEAA